MLYEVITIPPDDFADIETASELYLDNERAALLDLDGDNRFPDLCARYRKLDRITKRASGLRDAVKAQIALKVADATRAEGSGFRVTYPIVHRKERVQTIAAGTYRGTLTIKEIVITSYSIHYTKFYELLPQAVDQPRREVAAEGFAGGIDGGGLDALLVFAHGQAPWVGV